ncbi:component of the polarisome [Coemansia sp. RSA 1813]|nr:component of the polarisome [Coemansia sp. RSA 1843]KAJ2217711.1 component of the polarisome [Coemansia sp. RSA 487]KAJ2573052.1 component of the polarisome [Coemansia sp. RSA 1813]
METTAAQYHREMSKFIAEEIEQGAATLSKSEPGKLSRLSPMQFQELATDVFDELKRRRYEADALPFLRVRDHYHPKRNQARQKLATLSRPKFVDLVHDVDEGLKRRFPHKIDTSQSYGQSSHTASYESVNLSPVYNSPQSQQQQQQQQSAQGYGQYPSERSPPSSTNNTQGFAGYSQHGGSSNSYTVNDSLDSVDRVANDLNHAMNISQRTTSVRTPTPDGRNLRSPTNETEKLRNEYEMRIAAMRKRVGQLESQLLDYRGDNPHNNASEQIDNLERLNNVLTQKHERLENELKILREQLMSMKADIPALRQENDRLKQDRAQFIERERDLKSKLDEARSKLRKLKTTSVFAMDHGDSDLVPPPVFVNSGGVIRPSSVRVFQEAVEDLLSAVRSDDMQNDLPAAQSSVEMACGEIKADIHAYEIANEDNPDTWPLATNTRNRIADVVANLDGNLHGLIVAVDKHMNSMGVLPVSLLEAAASHLATSVVEIVKLLKVCFDESKAAPRVEAGPDHQSLEESTSNIITGIDSLYQIMRSPTPAPHALYSSLESVIAQILDTINICRAEFGSIESGSAPNVQINVELYNSQAANGILSGLEKGHLQLTDQLNDISDAQDAAGDTDLDNDIVRELLNEKAFKQRLTSALFDVGMHTKTVRMWLE